MVGPGGAIGSVLRFGSSALITTKYFPWSTLAINIAGSLLIGIIFALSITGNMVWQSCILQQVLC